jgi:hypothetical protein
MGGHPNHVDLAGGDLDEEQHVEALEQHRVDGEEITGQDRVGVGGQELLPGRSGPSGCRVAALCRIFHTVLAATR